MVLSAGRDLRDSPRGGPKGSGKGGGRQWGHRIRGHLASEGLGDKTIGIPGIQLCGLGIAGRPGGEFRPIQIQQVKGNVHSQNQQSRTEHAPPCSAMPSPKSDQSHRHALPASGVDPS